MILKHKNRDDIRADILPVSPVFMRFLTNIFRIYLINFDTDCCESKE